MLTVHGVSPQKANGNSALGQSHPSRQQLLEAGSRMSLSSYLGSFRTSQSHLKLICHNKPGTENHSEEEGGAEKLMYRCPLRKEKTIWQCQESRTGWELVSPIWADVPCRPPHSSFPSSFLKVCEFPPAERLDPISFQAGPGASWANVALEGTQDACRVERDLQTGKCLLKLELRQQPTADKAHGRAQGLENAVDQSMTNPPCRMVTHRRQSDTRIRD